MIVDLPNTTTADVAKRLVRLRADTGSMALSRVLTLLVVVDELDRDGAARRVAADHDGGAPIGRVDATDALLGCAHGQLS